MNLPTEPENPPPALFVAVAPLWDGGTAVMPIFRSGKTPPGEAEAHTMMRSKYGERLSARPSILGPMPLPDEIARTYLGLAQASAILREIQAAERTVPLDVGELLDQIFAPAATEPAAAPAAA